MNILLRGVDWKRLIVFIKKKKGAASKEAGTGGYRNLGEIRFSWKERTEKMMPSTKHQRKKEVGTTRPSPKRRERSEPAGGENPNVRHLGKNRGILTLRKSRRCHRTSPRRGGGRKKGEGPSCLRTGVTERSQRGKPSSDTDVRICQKGGGWKLG